MEGDSLLVQDDGMLDALRGMVKGNMPQFTGKVEDPAFTGPCYREFARAATSSLPGLPAASFRKLLRTAVPCCTLRCACMADSRVQDARPVRR